VQQLQREHGNAYVQQVVARQRTASSEGPRVQRDPDPTSVKAPPVPGPQSGGPPIIPFA
jgi:hypothetical protein